MKISITGASGFIGKLLVKKHLDLGDDVHVLTRNPEKLSEYNNQLHIHKGDLLDLESLVDFVSGADVLYHCAAEINDESIMRFINVDGTSNLLKAAISGKIKHWVQLSSTGVYGPIYSGTVTENQAYNPINEYERTKLESDFLVIAGVERNEFTYSILRPTNVFGFQMSNQSIFQLVKMIDKGFYFYIGPKGASANYVPVDNVVEALHLVAVNPKAKNQVYIISNWCKMEDFINNIAEFLNVPKPKLRFPINVVTFFAVLTSFIPKNPLKVSRIKALSNRVIYNTSKIEEELGFKSVVTVKDTIEILVQSYKNKNL